MQYDQTRYDVSISAIPKQGLVGLRAGVEGQSRAGTVIGGQLPVMPDSLSADMATALPIAGDEWLLYKATIEHARDGYGHCAAMVWNAAGELVAISRQTVTVFG